MARAKEKVDPTTGRNPKMCPVGEWGEEERHQQFSTHPSSCAEEMGAGALTICVSTTSAQSSQSLTPFKCPEESSKVGLCLKELCKVFQPRWGHLQPACFYLNCWKSVLVSPHRAAVAPGLCSQLFQWPPTWGRRRRGGGAVGGGQHAWACYLLHQHVETDRKMAVFVLQALFF